MKKIQIKNSHYIFAAEKTNIKSFSFSVWITERKSLHWKYICNIMATLPFSFSLDQGYCNRQYVWKLNMLPKGYISNYFLSVYWLIRSEPFMMYFKCSDAVLKHCIMGSEGAKVLYLCFTVHFSSTWNLLLNTSLARIGLCQPTSGSSKSKRKHTLKK